MKTHRFDGTLSTVARLFLSVSVIVITTASFLGAGGVMMGSQFLLKLHPYIFFIGFGNLAILILNRYLTAAIYPELKIDPLKQKRYISIVILCLVMITVAVAMEWPILTALTGLVLMILVAGPIREIFTTLSIPEIWKEVSVRYYIFDVLFLLNANLGLFTLGLKKPFPIKPLFRFLSPSPPIFLDPRSLSASASWASSTLMPGADPQSVNLSSASSASGSICLSVVYCSFSSLF